MVTPIEWGFFAILTTLTGLLSAYIVYKAIKPGLKATINGYIPVMARAMGKKMEELSEKALEGVDLGSIAGALGGEGGGSSGLGDIASSLTGQEGGIGELLKLFQLFGGKGKKGGGSFGL